MSFDPKSITLDILEIFNEAQYLGLPKKLTISNKLYGSWIEGKLTKRLCQCKGCKNKVSVIDPRKCLPHLIETKQSYYKDKDKWEPS